MRWPCLPDKDNLSPSVWPQADFLAFVLSIDANGDQSKPCDAYPFVEGCDAAPAPCPPPPNHVPCGCTDCTRKKKRRIIVQHHEAEEPERFGDTSGPVGGDQPGAYLAPPQSGRVVEGGRSYSLRGLGIRFPEVRLALPTIELPRIVRNTEHSRMVLDSAVAPFPPTATNERRERRVVRQHVGADSIRRL